MIIYFFTKPPECTAMTVAMNVDNGQRKCTHNEKYSGESKIDSDIAEMDFNPSQAKHPLPTQPIISFL